MSWPKFIILLTVMVFMFFWITSDLECQNMRNDYKSEKIIRYLGEIENHLDILKRNSSYFHTLGK